MMNFYCNQINELSVYKKYTKWYVNIITKALSRTEQLEYTERHHILPKSFKLGGEKDIKNIVKLTPREHFLCHYLLSKMFNGSLKIKMCFALFSMHRIQKRNQKIIYNSRQYEIIQRANVYARRNSIGTFTGKHHSEETKQRISEAKKGKTIGRPQWNKGKKHSSEHLKNQITGILEYRKNHPDWDNSFREGRKKAEAKRLLKVSKKTTVNGVEYSSASEAARQLGINKITLIYRVKSKNFPNYQYADV